jgi:hypothetical protein
MTKKKILLFIVVTMLFGISMGCQSPSSYGDSSYGDATISYLLNVSHKPYLYSYDIDTQQESRFRAGKNEKDVFWFLYDVYDGGNIAVSNKDEVYILDSAGMSKYEDILMGIVAIKRVGDVIFIISQWIDTMGEMNIWVYNNDFSERLYYEAVPGYYCIDSVTRNGSEIIFTSYDMKAQTSSVHRLNLDNPVKIQGIRSQVVFDSVAQTIPIEADGKLYLFINSIDINNNDYLHLTTLYSVEEDRSLAKIKEFDKRLFSAWHSGNDLYLLLGVNQTSLYSLSLESFEERIIYTTEMFETMGRAYMLAGRRYLVSDKGFYRFENGVVEKIRSWDTRLTNVYN